MRYLPASKYAQTLKYLYYNYTHRDQGIAYPLYASYKINRTCNYQCRFCDLWHDQQPGLPTEEVLRVLDNIGRSSIVLLSIEGGEPLLRPDLLEVIKYARRQPFYLLVTTSERGLADAYPMREYCKYIDFLHISIDEGHVNLDMFDELEEYVSFGSSVCVQTVVTNKDIDRLEYKVRRCWEAGAKIVIMPAVHLEGTKDHYPDFDAFRKKALQLRRQYPDVVITPDNFYSNVDRGACSTSSIIIDADGTLYYPCRVLPYRGTNLLETPLMEFVRTERARRLRSVMTACDRRCGWYQYFATSSYTSPRDAFTTIRPYFAELLGRRPKPRAKIERLPKIRQAAQ